MGGVPNQQQQIGMGKMIPGQQPVHNAQMMPGQPIHNAQMQFGHIQQQQQVAQPQVQQLPPQSLLEGIFWSFFSIFFFFEL